MLGAVTESIEQDHDVEWLNVCDLKMGFCTGCMVCRDKGECVLPQDDAHAIAGKIRAADALVVGTPTYWGNMSAPLKLLFDRTVPVFMGESTRGMPLPRQKGKRAMVVTACTTPWPFNFLLPESRGALRAVREVLHYGGYRILGTLTKPGTKKSSGVQPSLAARARRMGMKLVGR